METNQKAEKKGRKEKKERPKVSHRMSVSLTDEVYGFISEIAEQYHKSSAAIFRSLLANNLHRYLGHVRYVDPVQGGQILGSLSDCAKQLEGIKNELRRIGINYNQELRIKNIQAKIAEHDMRCRELVRQGTALGEKSGEVGQLANEITALKKERSEIEKSAGTAQKFGQLLAKYNEITSRLEGELKNVFVNTQG